MASNEANPDGLNFPGVDENNGSCFRNLHNICSGLTYHGNTAACGFYTVNGR